MYIHSVKMINYKSIGDYENAEVILEPRITTIIGKNESGKSNILEGLSQISFLRKNDSAFSDENVNRIGDPRKKNSFCIILKPREEEKNEGLTEDTNITISKNQYSATGGILIFYKQKIFPDVNQIVEILDSIGNNPFGFKNQTDIDWYRFYKTNWKREDYIDIPTLEMSFDYLKRYLNLLPNEQKECIQKILNRIINQWKEMCSFFPSIYYRKSDKHLKSRYK